MQQLKELGGVMGTVVVELILLGLFRSKTRDMAKNISVKKLS